MNPDRAWDVLFVGAGVIGSIYAARLAGGGHNVTLLDRGERLRELRRDGLVLEPVIGKKRVSLRLPTAGRLEPADRYDLLVVPVRNDHVDALLPMLAANTATPSVLFMVNNPAGYQSWLDAVGPERLLLGFPGAGGTVSDGVVRYHVVSRLLQPTTFGSPDGRVTPRLREVSRLFARTGLPVAVVRNMDAWQKYHVAWVTPCSYAIYYALERGVPIASCREAWELAVDGIREGFAGLRQMKYPLTPAKLALFDVLPRDWLVRVFLGWANTKHFDTVAVRHALKAREEMEALAVSLLRLLQAGGARAPALQALLGSGGVAAT